MSTPISDPTITEMINDPIDLEEALTKLFCAFTKKYPRATHEIECRVAYGDHLSPAVRIKSTF